MDPAHRQGEIGAQCQVYQPLSPRQTRTLRVHPSADSDVEIECDLFTVDLKKKSGATVAGSSKKAGYEALSYTWGDPEPTKRILVNGLPFWIAANLFAALRQLRLPERPRVLWTDAICINQNDLIEKAGQVGMMFSIYLKAYRVVVWLGQATNDDEYLFSLLKTYGREGMGGIRGEVEGPRARRAATKLIETKPWFQRTWTRQEVHAAHKVHVACGSQECSFEDFQFVMDRLLPDMDEIRDTFRPNRDPRERALSARRAYVFFKQHCENDMYTEEGGFHQAWFRMIMRSSLYEATLPQDRVFAVLGIIGEMTKEAYDVTEGFPEIDYSKSVSTVFESFQKHTINISQTLASLQIFYDRDAVGQDLPSWAIDLRQNVTRLMLRFGVFHFDMPYTAPPVQAYDEYGLLRLEGARIGIITSTESPWKGGMHREFNSEILGSYTSGVGLESCYSSHDWWMPDNQGNKGIEEVYKILEMRCSYNWAALEPRNNDVIEEYNLAKHHCLVFVSHLVREGDIIIHPSGAEMPFVLRPDTEAGRFSFLGPAIIAMGVVRKLKDRDMFTYAFPHRGSGCDVGSPESFVLI
ncbi:hypothetical protein FOVG_15848 [Fusarium oxysporum f. sp. pisi HDV247]|uniref:Heterokaryon incompatibility domain-containing protein n=1 Tax=Fusarium oxysporum f. sp. pisi HDV247 TaxID=1080344 RepID=W9NZ76_FUSOX|nr:hypothetical protein FOVG_15848 [Fusarium oxysporum f. sp. pisi HDV247]